MKIVKEVIARYLVQENARTIYYSQIMPDALHYIYIRKLNDLLGDQYFRAIVSRKIRSTSSDLSISSIVDKWDKILQHMTDPIDDQPIFRKEEQ